MYKHAKSNGYLYVHVINVMAEQQTEKKYTYNQLKSTTQFIVAIYILGVFLIPFRIENFHEIEKKRWTKLL